MAAADISKVNGSVSLAPNQTAGRVSTVNGSVQIGALATADAVSTVNGQINVGAGARIRESAAAVNGRIQLNGTVEGATPVPFSGDKPLR